MTNNIQEKRRKRIRGVSFIILLLITIGFMRRPILPPELSDLPNYWWTVQQEVTEPDVYVFYRNGKVRVFNYSSDIICNWSYREGRLHIWNYSLFSPFNKTYKDVRIEQFDNGIFMYTNTTTFFAHMVTGCERLSGDYFPDIRVFSGNENIEWVVGVNRIGNTEYDRMDNFNWIMQERSPDDLVYLKDGEVISIKFNGKVPSTSKLTEHIIQLNGSIKYQTEYKGKTIDIKFKKGKGSFTLEPNYVTSLSSNSEDYLPGATLKGYRLICNWGTDQCEYTFVIRGDAALEVPEPQE